MKNFSAKEKFFYNETRSTVTICWPLAITVDKKYEVPLIESDREAAYFNVEGYGSQARCTSTFI